MSGGNSISDFISSGIEYRPLAPLAISLPHTLTGHRIFSLGYEASKSVFELKLPFNIFIDILVKTGR